MPGTELNQPYLDEPRTLRLQRSYYMEVHIKLQ